MMMKLKNKDALELNPDTETILFEKKPLENVLNAVWKILKPDAETWMELRNSSKAFTRSIPAQTKDKIKHLGDSERKLEIDLFIKVISKRGPYEYIVGVDKDGPDELRRITTTEYIPTEGKWIGDRRLPPMERMVIITLKWWKQDKSLPIKSHHLLSALNALVELDPTDPLYLPKLVSSPYSNKRVMEIMKKILDYLDGTYNNNPCNFLLIRKNSKDKDIKDYPFPEVSRELQDKLFIQFYQENDGKDAAKIKSGGQLKDLSKKLDDAIKKLKK